jgi:uncharacterized membrane protein YhaH (DUF805 family)
VSDRRGTAVRIAALAAAFLGLLALVALASRAGLPWAGTDEGSEGRSLALVGRVAADALLIALAVILLGVVVLRARRQRLAFARPADEEEEAEEPRGRLARLAIRVVPYVLLALIVLLTILFAREVDRRFPRGDPPGLGASEGDPAAGRSLSPPADAASWVLVAAGLLVLLALFVAAAVVAVRRRRAAREPDKLHPLAVSRVLDESIDDLWGESDPRRAVIAAYARMERGLAGRDYGRRPSEAPLEYVTRVLSELGAGREPVRRLTGLFERAKFSRHAMGPEAKAEAIDCLVAIRSGLS